MSKIQPKAHLLIAKCQHSKLNLNTDVYEGFGLAKQLIRVLTRKKQQEESFQLYKTLFIKRSNIGFVQLMEFLLLQVLIHTDNSSNLEAAYGLMSCCKKASITALWKNHSKS